MKIDYLGRTKFEDHEIVEGAAATFYIGSDHYAETVIAVDRYKSGTRKGQVKEIRTKREAFRPTIDKNGNVDYCLISPTLGRKVGYGYLVVGYAEDYRDPSF